MGTFFKKRWVGEWYATWLMQRLRCRWLHRGPTWKWDFNREVNLTFKRGFKTVLEIQQGFQKGP
jgi:hypothetical protein